MNSKEKIDLGSTHTFHRRNLSSLIASINEDEEDTQDNNQFVQSTAMHDRRPLEEIEQGSTYAYGEESQEEMNSQDSAFNNSPNLNSNQKVQQEPAIPQDGFYDMVEQPSLDYIEDGDGNMEEEEKEKDQEVMEFPSSYRKNDKSNDAVNMTPPTKAPRNNKKTGFSFSNMKTPQQEGTASRGELISQATNESCSSGNDEEEGASAARMSRSPTTPYEKYAQSRSITNTKPPEEKAGSEVLQYYQESNASKNSLQDANSRSKASKKTYVDASDEGQSSPEQSDPNTISSKKRYVDMSSPETRKEPLGQKLNFGKGLQIEIDSDEEDRAEIVQPAPRGQGKVLHHSQLIQFEEQDESQDDGDIELYGNMPAHSQTQFNTNQPFTIKQQSKEAKQKPHTTKNTNENMQQFVRPGVDDYNQNAFSQEQMQRSQDVRQNQTSEELSSVSISAQMKSNGQIRFGQQSSSRVSDRIYEKAHGMSPPNLNDFSPSDTSSANRGRRAPVNLTGELDRQQQHRRQQWQKTQENYPMHAEQQLSSEVPKEASHRTITSEDSDERAARLRREDAMEYEIRRLEEMNQIEAQRLKESETDESRQSQEEEKEEDFNLLEGQIDAISPVRALQESRGVLPTNQPPEVFQKNSNDAEDINDRDENMDNEFMYDQLIENKVMSEGNSEEPYAQNSGRCEIKSPDSHQDSARHSRKLYVITEESHSNIGPAMSMSEYGPSLHNQLYSNQKAASSGKRSAKQDQGSDQQQMQRVSLLSYPYNEVNNSATMASRSTGSANRVDFEKNPQMNNTVGDRSTGTQGFNDYLRNINNQQNESDAVLLVDEQTGAPSGPSSQYALSAQSQKGVQAYNSNPNTRNSLKQRSQHDGQLNNMILDSNPVIVQKFNNSASEYKAIRTGSLRTSQEAPNPAGSSQRNIAFRDPDGNSVHLRQASAGNGTSALKGDSEKGRALLAHATREQQPFEIISDEDLLASNFDRISKIGPNADFNYDDSFTPKRRGTEASDAQSKILALLNEIKQLQGVIKIKDNTILQMQETRNSVADQSKLFIDAACYAKPDTNDVKCQTHGPKKKAYYDSIPAKVNTNLKERERSASDDQYEYRGSSKIVRYKSVADKKVSPEKRTKESANGSFISPNKKMISPESAREQGIHKEDVKSLRVQLQSLKAQLNDQEADNLTLIEKVTSLEAAIQGHEKRHGEFVQQLRQKVIEKKQLEEKVEEMTKTIDSLRADNVELKQLTMLNDEQVQQVIELQSDIKERTHKSRLEVGKNDCQVQTDESLWIDFLHQQSRRQQSDDILGSVTSPLHLQPQPIIGHQQTLINTLMEQLSQEHELSGEQGNSKDVERVNHLVERANAYEQQYQNIEQEIIEYKRALQQAHEQQALNQQFQLMNNQPTTYESLSHPQIETRGTHHSRVQSASTPMNNANPPNQQQNNLIDYINSAGSEHNLNNSMQGTNQGATANHGIDNLMSLQNQLNATGQSNPLVIDQQMQGNSMSQPQMSWLQEQYTHYKRKAKKLEKKNQKLEFEKVTNQKLIQEFQQKQQEMNEKYRDLRQKFQMKLHEKNIKISELKTTINQLQLFAPQQYLQQQALTSNNLTSMNSNPAMNIVEPQFSEGTLPHNTHESVGEVTSQMHGLNSTQQNVINERQRIPRPQQPSRNGQLHHQKNSSTDNLGITGVSAVDKSALGVSVMTSPGEIYHMISGIVDQKIADEQARQNQLSSQNQSMNDKRDVNRHHTSGNQLTRGTTNKSSSAAQRMEGHQQRYYKSPDIESREFRLQKSGRGSAGSLQRQVDEFYQPRVRMLSPSLQGHSTPEQELLFTQTHELQQTNQTLVSSPFQQQPNYMRPENEENRDHNIQEQDNHDTQVPRRKKKKSKTHEHSRHPNHGSRNEVHVVSQTYSPSGRQAQEMLNYYMEQNAQLIASFDPQKQQEPSAEMLSSIKSNKKKESLAQSFSKSKTGRMKSKRDREDQRTKRHQSSPTHKPRSVSRKSSERRPQQYRDNSVKSALSKDDVMPCYKYKVEGKKRVDVVHQPKPLALGYLEPRTLREQATTPSERVFSVRYQQPHENAQGKARAQEGPADLHRYQQHDQNAGEGKISQMLNVHFNEYMQPQQQDLQQQIEWLKQQTLSNATSSQRIETDPVIDIYQRPRYTK